MASPTVKIVSAASSGISQPNSSSKAMTSSTVSRLSAPRSSMKLAFSVTLSGSTPRCSTTIFLTRSPISLIVSNLFSQRDPTTMSRPVQVFAAPNLGDNQVFQVLATAADQRRTEADAHPRAPRLKTATPTQLTVRLPHFLCVDQRRRALCTQPLSPSNHGHSAVHMQRLPGHIGGLVGGKKGNRSTHLVHRAGAARRYSGQDSFALLVVQLVGHRRDDKSRRNAIGGNAAFCVFLRDRFDHAGDAG